MRIGVYSVIFLSLLCISFVFAESNMVVEANIMNSSGDGQPESVIGLSVPDYIFFGNLSKGEQSEEIKVTVNNTGNVDLFVTPTLINSSEKIFNYTYFRLYKTHSINGTTEAVPFTKIGDFSFDVNAESHKYFYITLDLTNYPEEISENMIGHTAEIRFVAMEE